MSSDDNRTLLEMIGAAQTDLRESAGQLHQHAHTVSCDAHADVVRHSGAMGKALDVLLSCEKAHRTEVLDRAVAVRSEVVSVLVGFGVRTLLAAAALALLGAVVAGGLRAMPKEAVREFVAPGSR